jgi:hypothetical protein
VSRRLGPPFLIALLGLAFFSPLAIQPDGVLYSDYSDFINYHIPCKYFLVHAWHETGELPLWCPEMFAGMPFVHDVQVSAFYPVHAVLYLLPEAHIASACSWLIVFHVVLAGLCMYAYARHQGLGAAGALVAALEFMFAGKWLMHMLVGGWFIVGPLAWLPLVLLFLEQAIERASLVRATAAGLAFAMIVLATHPQLTFYSGLFAAMWTLGTTRAQSRSESHWAVHVGRWLAFGVWTAMVAVLVCAIQLLPALEATGESSRALGVPPGDIAGAVTSAVRSLLGLVGPPLTPEWAWFWEERCGLGLIGLALAIASPVLAPNRRVRVQAGMTLAWTLLGLGGLLLFQRIPGFHLFRGPSRMLILLGLPIGMLTGAAVDALVAGTSPSLEQRRRSRHIVLGTAVVVLAALALFAVSRWQQEKSLQFAPYWLLLALTLPLTWWLLGRSVGSTALAAAWLAVVLVDLWALALPEVAVRSEEEVFTPSRSVEYLVGRAGERGRVFDVCSAPSVTSSPKTPLWPNFAMMVGVEPVRGYNPLDLRRYKEYLELLINRDQPLRALHDFTLPCPGTFPLTNAALTDLLGVRFLLLPHDVPLESIVPDAAAQVHWKKVFEDPAPRTYNFVPSTEEGNDGGLQALPPYAVYENTHAFPRAFIVPHASRMPERGQWLTVMKTVDFRREVLLEDADETALEGNPSDASSDSTATILDYRPNRVTIAIDGSAPGWLVLTDVWFPGWKCTVDGEEVQVRRANGAFRAVAVPARSHRVEFTFAPRSYFLGRTVTLVALAGVVLFLGLAGAVRARDRRKRVP